MPVQLKAFLREWTQSLAYTENVEFAGKFICDLVGKVTLMKKGKECRV